MTKSYIKMLPESFDLIVVGAGHAGSEATMAAANMGLKTLLLTSNLDRVGHTSCNPAIGGLGKGHMVHEIDALGGFMGKWTDQAALQVRKLNASKGPAVQATRAQIDREVYMSSVKNDIFSHPNIFFCQGMVDAVLTKNGVASGVRTSIGQDFFSRAVLLTAGTFLSGQIHIGDIQYPGGRFGDAASTGLPACLKNLGLELGRFMTCTTPRVLTASVDFSKMEIQPGDTPTPRFSSRGNGPELKQVPCYLTWTNEQTHKIIEEGLLRSAIYNGDIPGAGPRYCPSIEDKIARFPDKERHQIFVEPEGHNSPETYPNNIPTGLPFDVQLALLHSIPGFENCHIVRPGYAIEYDVIPPTQLASTFETKKIPGLWCAGQINGTSGYEEAAAQGLWAAMNIAAKLKGMSPFLPGRNQSYIAVLADDLVTKGTNEPYRMFTSRAEYRLLLRESNADMRLTPLGREYGLVGDEQWNIYINKKKQFDELMMELSNRKIRPDNSVKGIFTKIGESIPHGTISLSDLLKRPNITTDKIALLWPEVMDYPESVRFEAETAIHYAGYVVRQNDLARKQLLNDKVIIPPTIKYIDVAGLTTEVRDKLSSIQPTTLGQASRVPGVTPAAIASIEIYLKKIERKITSIA